MYSPAVGRFLQRDSFGGYGTLGQSLNRYVYSGNNPATSTDPSGHDSFWNQLQDDLAFVNQRFGPQAMRDSWNYAKRMGQRFRDNPQRLWEILTSDCVLDAIQEALDLMGMMPGAGITFDLINAMLSAGRGNYGDAIMRMLFAAPGFGDLAAGSRLAAKHLLQEGVEHYADDVVEEGLDYLSGVCRRLSNSFSGDTLVRTPAGTVPISQIQVGDLIVAYNQATGATGTFTVTAIVAHVETAQVQVTLGGETLDSTPEHPFYVLLRGWIAATALHVGDQVRNRDGSYGTVTALTRASARRVVYNLTVAEAATFFVGDDGWLVHHAGCSPWAKKLNLNPSSVTTQQLFENRNLTVQEYLAKFRVGNIKGKMPTEALSMTVDEALRQGKVGGVNVRKLLTDLRDKFTK